LLSWCCCCSSGNSQQQQQLPPKDPSFLQLHEVENKTSSVMQNVQICFCNSTHWRSAAPVAVMMQQGHWILVVATRRSSPPQLNQFAPPARFENKVPRTCY
jgi:hypothetical protein